VGAGSISLVGDVMVRTPGFVCEAIGEPRFDAACRALTSGDRAVGNLEIPLSRRGYRVPKTVNLRAEPEVIDDIAALGLNVVSLANNHLMDFGPEAMLDTVAACDAVGIKRCGAGVDVDAALAPAWIAVGKQRVAVISVACTLPVESEAGPGKPGIAPLRVRFAFEIDPNLLAEQPGTVPWVHSHAIQEDQERVCRAVEQCHADGADVVVVAIHWGVPSHWLSPYQGLICEYQQPLAHALIDAGADVICGHHAHQLHPIELYRGKPIFYSLGNFVFQGLGDYAFMGRESVIAQLTLDECPRIELIPLMLGEQGLPRRAIEGEAKRVLNSLRELSLGFGTEIDITRDYAVVRTRASNGGESGDRGADGVDGLV
jgi:poly-gamma-glutamate synthesis protein (capsule biosynthesis protein)